MFFETCCFCYRKEYDLSELMFLSLARCRWEIEKKSMLQGGRASIFPSCALTLSGALQARLRNQVDAAARLSQAEQALQDVCILRGTSITQGKQEIDVNQNSIAHATITLSAHVTEVLIGHTLGDQRKDRNQQTQIIEVKLARMQILDAQNRTQTPEHKYLMAHT